MSIDSNFRTDLKALISSAWPEIVNGKGSVAGSIQWESKLNRENWENLVNDGKLTPPYVIIEYSMTPADDEGPNDCMMHRAMASVWYVTDENDSNAWINAGDHSQGKDIASYLSDKARTFIEAVWHYTGTAFDLLGKAPSWDVGSSNAANKVFYDLLSKKQAVEIRLPLLLGEYFSG